MTITHKGEKLGREGGVKFLHIGQEVVKGRGKGWDWGTQNKS